MLSGCPRWARCYVHCITCTVPFCHLILTSSHARLAYHCPLTAEEAVAQSAKWMSGDRNPGGMASECLLLM